MVVGVIGPLDSGQKIKKYLNEIDDSLQVKLYVKEKVSEMIEVIELCESECESVIFTGCGVDAAIKSKYNVKIPNTYVSRCGTSVFKAFWEANKCNINLERFSIDVVENNIIDNTVSEIDINYKDIYSLPFSTEIDEMEYAKWHRELYDNNKIDVVFTGFGAVYNELKREGYPVFRLEVTRQAIKVSYDELKNKCALKKAKYSQIAVEILQIQDYKSSKENYYSDMVKKSEINTLIVEYVKKIQGSIFNFGRDEYIVFSHKGAIDNEENFNELLKLQKDIKSKGFSLAIGIGIGMTAYQAETNGYKSLKRCLESNKYEIYSIDEKDYIKGPLGSSDELKYSLVTSEKKLIEISEKTGLSCESIAKIMAITKVRLNNVYDTKELAGHLGISDRSARRILNKIVDSGYGKVYAKESSNGGGRPKSLIEVNL